MNNLEKALISGFQCECHGFFSGFIDGKEVKSYQTFEAGVHRDGWFTNDHLVAQIKELSPVIRDIHPGCDIVIAYDNSMTHHERAPDGLEAHDKLPLKDNGKRFYYLLSLLNYTININIYTVDSIYLL